MLNRFSVKNDLREERERERKVSHIIDVDKKKKRFKNESLR